jgi:putative membrane protein
MTDERPSGSGDAIRSHLANERTLLAWQRTAITVMGLGFLADRLAAGSARGADSWLIGLLLIVIGGAVSVMGVYRYVRTTREIESSTYRPSLAMHLVLAGLVVAGAVLLAGYLVWTRGV